MVDKDLLSIQQARTLVRGARAAQKKIADLGQARVDAAVEAIAQVAVQMAEELAKMAVEETGFGIWQDKKAKNLLASESLAAHIREMKTIGIINEDRQGKIIEIATPAGVLAGLIPSTNPTSTTIFKAIIAIKAGNAIVFSPHPGALNCITETVNMIRAVLVQLELPEDLVNVMSVPTVDGTRELMAKADLILATGGTAMVRAAYSSGTPALGVGPGNVPVFIERSADVAGAIDKIISSKTFDNGTVCASEQAIIVEGVIAQQVKQCLASRGGHFLTGEDLAKVKAIMETPTGGMNPAIVGRDANFIAQRAGITIPAGTTLLLCEEQGVGPQYPFSKEKLCALMGFYTVEEWQAACELCFQLLKNGGLGHTLALHSTNEQVIREFAMKKPVSRLVVNTPSTQGAVGLTTSLAPSFTLGCGNVGGSSTSDNVGPEHLFNIRRVAYGLEETTGCSASQGDIDVAAVTRMIVAELDKMGYARRQ